MTTLNKLSFARYKDRYFIRGHSYNCKYNMLRIFAIYAKKTETWIFHGYMVQKQKKIFNTVLRDLKGFGI